MPAVVGVDLVHCQQQAAEAVAESSGALQLLQGELIATVYFDTLAAEVADSLKVGPMYAHCCTFTQL